MNELAPISKSVLVEASFNPDIEKDLNILFDEEVFEAAARADFAVNPLKLTARALGSD